MCSLKATQEHLGYVLCVHTLNLLFEHLRFGRRTTQQMIRSTPQIELNLSGKLYSRVCLLRVDSRTTLVQCVIQGFQTTGTKNHPNFYPAPKTTRIFQKPPEHFSNHWKTRKTPQKSCFWTLKNVFFWALRALFFRSPRVYKIQSNHWNIISSWSSHSMYYSPKKQ